jgi:4-hydroxy-3-polyprenylbenzoate decarboxylase
MDDVPGEANDDRRRSAENSPQSMRTFLAALDAAGQVTTIEQTVSTDFEIAACLAELDAGPALRFERVNGHQMPVVGNLLNSLARVAMGLGTTQPKLQSAIIGAIESRCRIAS